MPIKIESVARADLRALVAKDSDAECRQEREPLVDTREVLVIAGDEVDAVPRAKTSERREEWTELLHRAIDEITRDGHERGLERVDARDE